MKLALRTTANAAAFLALPLLALTLSTIDTKAQANRQVTAIERRVQTMDQQSKQYELDNMGRDDKKPKVDPQRTREIREQVAEDLKNLQTLYNDIVVKLQSQEEVPDWYPRHILASAKQLAVRLKKNLAFARPTDLTGYSAPELRADTQRKILRSLASLISALITNSAFESTSGLNIQQAGIASMQLDTLIAFTDPIRREETKSYPLKISDLLFLYTRTDPEQEHDSLDKRALEIVRTRCVDFLDDGTTFWSLRTIGASDELMREVSKCVSPERHTFLSNRRAGFPAAELKKQEIVLVDELIRILFQKKDLANRRRFLEAGREYLRRWEFDPDAKELVDWLKARWTVEEEKIKVLETAVKK